LLGDSGLPIVFAQDLSEAAEKAVAAVAAANSPSLAAAKASS